MEQTIERSVVRVDESPELRVGNLGAGHLFRAVLTPNDAAALNPFLLLTEERLDFPDGAVLGQPDGHAGLESLTWVLSGALVNRESGMLFAGDVERVASCRGVLHNKRLSVFGPTRILRLWTALPPCLRHAAPQFAVRHFDEVPLTGAPGVQRYVFSNGAAGRSEPWRGANLTMVEYRLRRDVWAAEALAVTQTAFLYVLDGVIEIGLEHPVHAEKGDVAWLSRAAHEGATSVYLRAIGGSARAVLFACDPVAAPALQNATGPAGEACGEDLASLKRGLSSLRLPS